MRQISTQQTLTSYTLTITDTLLAGQTIISLDGCTITVDGVTPALPYLLVANQVLGVTHGRDRTHPSGMSLLAPGTAEVANVARLSSTVVPMPGIRASGAATVHAVSQFSMNFTVTSQTAAEGVLIDADGLSADSVIDVNINDAVGVPFAYGVGLQNNANVGISETQVTFANPANLPPGNYVLTVGFKAGTLLTLPSGAARQNGVTAYAFDLVAVTYSFSRIVLLSGAGNVLGRLSAGAMRVVAAPTVNPTTWYDTCAEIVAAPAAVPYLRTRHEGVNYKVTLVPE